MESASDGDGEDERAVECASDDDGEDESAVESAVLIGGDGDVASSSETTRPQRRVLVVEGTEPEHAATTPTTSMLRQAGAPYPFYSPILSDVVPNIFYANVPRPLTPSEHGNHAGFVNAFLDSSDPPSMNV